MITLHYHYVRILNGDWSFHTQDANGLDALVLARTLPALQRKAHRLRDAGHHVSTTAYRHIGVGADAWLQPHFNALLEPYKGAA